MKKRLKAALILGLALVVTLGCTTTTKTVYVKPECSAAEPPDTPVVTVEELQLVSDDVYRKLYVIQQKLYNWGYANFEIINEVCQN